MGEDADEPEISPFVASMTTRIVRRAAKYAEQVAGLLATSASSRHPDAENQLLDEFNLHIEAIVAKYDPPSSRRRGDSLVFRHLYAPVTTVQSQAEPAGEGVPITYLAALLAADVEFRGPLRLSRTQRALLARVYERLGSCLRSAGLPAHAALAYSRALELHRDNEDDDAEDRCGLAKARAETAALWPLRRRVGRWISEWSCGYGYRPFRLLFWMVVQLAVFTVAITLLTHESFGDSVYLCLANYLNPAGLGDAADFNGPARTLLVTEAYAGIVSTSVFFALLVRRWFRI
ncbi:hypothetical protein [Nocardia higoensis]|uniref:hypothetical protein n=1 Tax=Nocardia higoensis TaxID=228599 RepID=UPI0002D6D5BA|nr:hypothetical protein [Nocardia higoensis]